MTTAERLKETFPIVIPFTIVSLYITGLVLLPSWVMALLTALVITAFFTFMIVGFHYAQNRAYNNFGLKDTDDKG